MIINTIKKIKIENYYQYIPSILIFIVGFILSFFRWASEDEVLYLKETMIISEFLKMGQWFGNEDVGSHGFIFKIPVAIFYLITGPNVFIATLYHIVLAFFATLISYKIFNHFFKNNTFSLLATILTTFSYYYISVLNTYYRDIPVMFALVVFIYCLIKEKPYWLIGFLFLLVLDAKEYIAIILTPVLLLWLPFVEYQKNRLSLKFIANVLYKPVLLFAPSVLYLYLMFFSSIVPVNYFIAGFLNFTAIESNVAKVNIEQQKISFGTDTTKLFSTIQNGYESENEIKEVQKAQSDYVKSLEPVKRSLELRKQQPKRTIAVKENEIKNNIKVAKANNSKQEKNNVNFYGRSEGRDQEVTERKNLESRKVESIKKPENKLITENRKTETKRETVTEKKNLESRKVESSKKEDIKQNPEQTKVESRIAETKKETGIGKQELGRKEEQLLKTEKEKQVQAEKKRLEEQKPATEKQNTENRVAESKRESGIGNQELGKKEEQLSKTEKEKQLQAEKKRLEEQKVTGKNNEESRQTLITKKEEQKPVIRRKEEQLAKAEKEKQLQAEKKRLEEQKTVTAKQNTENRITETRKESGIRKQELGRKEEQLSKTEKEKQVQAEKKRIEEQKPVIEKQNTGNRITETRKESGIGKQELGRKEEQLSKTEKEKQVLAEKKRLEEQKVTSKTNEESLQSLIIKKEEQKPVMRRKEEQLEKAEKEKQLQAEKKRLEEQKPVTEKKNTENRITETKKEYGIGNNELGKKEEKLAKAEKERLDEQKNVIKKKEEQSEEKFHPSGQISINENNYEEDNSLSLTDTITGKKIGNISEEEDIENLKEENFFKLKQSNDSLSGERSEFLNKLENIGITILNVFIVYGQKILSPRTFSYMSFPLYMIIFSLFACISLLKKNYKRPDFLFVSIYLFIYLAVYLIRPSHARYLLHLVPILSLYVIYFFIQGLDSYKKLLIPVLFTLPLTAATLYFEVTMPLIKLLAHLFFYSLLFFIIYLLYKNRKELAKKVSIAFILLLSFFTFGSSLMASYTQGQIAKYMAFGYNNEYKEIAKYFNKNKSYMTNIRVVNAGFIQFYNKDINQGVEPWRFGKGLVLKEDLPKLNMESKYNYIPNFYFTGGFGNISHYAENNIDYFVLLKSLKPNLHIFPYVYSKDRFEKYFEKKMNNLPEWFEFERKISLKNKVLYFYRIKYEE